MAHHRLGETQQAHELYDLAVIRKNCLASNLRPTIHERRVSHCFGKDDRRDLGIGQRSIHLGTSIYRDIICDLSPPADSRPWKLADRL